MLGDRRRRQKTYLAAIKAKALIYSDAESTLSYLIQVEFEASKRNLTLFFPECLTLETDIFEIRRLESLSNFYTLNVYLSLL